MLRGILQQVIHTRAFWSLAIAIVFALPLAGSFLLTTVLILRLRQARTWRKNLSRVGIQKGSNLNDQYDSQYHIPENSRSKTPIRIKALYIHPIKSCGVIELNQAILTKTGFAYDRIFAWAVEEKNEKPSQPNTWRLITQRTKPQMSQIETELWLPSEESDMTDPIVRAGGCLVVSFPSPEGSNLLTRIGTFMDTGKWSSRHQIRFIVPLMPTGAQMRRHGLHHKKFIIHYRTTEGLDLSGLPAISKILPQLKTYLKIPPHQNLTLLRCTPEGLSRTDRNLAPLRHIGSPSMHGYTDQQPININNISSVHAVSKLLPPENQPLNALRFRANIWITGAPAYVEETWKRYRIIPQPSNLRTISPTLSVVCRTSRCTMPNVNPEKGIFDEDTPLPGRKKGKAQPSTTLVEYRTVEDGNKAALGYLGMHCVPEDSCLMEAQDRNEDLYVHVGDEIEVIETGTHLFGSTGNDY